MRFAPKYNEKDSSACGLIGWMSRSGRRMAGDAMIEAIASMRERGNGLGGGFAAYGIYPDFREHYCFHTMFGSDHARGLTEDLIADRFDVACDVVAAPFWKDIDAETDLDEKHLEETLRQVYASAVVNGPFAILLGFGNGLLGLNDRIKLRPMVAAENGDELYISSEESAIRVICPEPDRVWMPTAGEPVIGFLDEGVATSGIPGAQLPVRSELA
jgi:glutamate synthase domain-containing protein 1